MPRPRPSDPAHVPSVPQVSFAWTKTGFAPTVLGVVRARQLLTRGSMISMGVLQTGHCLSRTKCLNEQEPVNNLKNTALPS